MNTHNKLVNFFTACAGMLLFGITLITLGAVLPDLRSKFGLDEVVAGAIFAILPLGILAGSLVFGPFCDKYGFKWILIVSCIFIGLGLYGIAHIQNLDLLKIGIFLFGFSGGIVNGATNALVSDISDRDKEANLSLLGVFFSIGALGMPFVLGLYKSKFGFEWMLSVVSMLAFAVAIFMFFIQFPPPKSSEKVKVAEVLKLLRNGFILVVAFFLFFQSSLEAIVHNWITTYLIQDLHMSEDKALFALTLNVAGMAVMRLIMGGMLRKVSNASVLWLSMAMVLVSGVLLVFVESYYAVVSALVLLGAGLAAGFPVMYGIVGRHFPNLTATAFSFILTVALIGNMSLNYGMGIVAKHYGIGQVVPAIILEAVCMAMLCWFILKKEKTVGII